MLVIGKEWKPLVSDLYVRVPLNFFFRLGCGRLFSFFVFGVGSLETSEFFVCSSFQEDRFIVCCVF